MNRPDRARKAELLRGLHRAPEPLVLPNAWDCASARIFEESGFPAIATTSAGVAFSLGYADGQQIPAAAMLEAVARIAACVGVPLTADLEAGYGDIAATARALIESGAVGLNLEDAAASGTDGFVPVEEQAARIATVRRVANDAGVPLVINARTDIYLRQHGPATTRFERCCDRLRSYIAAGADCVFVPGVADEETIGRLVAELRFPLNVLAVQGTPPVSRLRALGVARVSIGSGIARSAMGHTRRVARELKEHGSFASMLEGAIPYAEANALFAGPQK